MIHPAPGSTRASHQRSRRSFAHLLTGTPHQNALLVYLLIATLHFAEHLAQLAQIHLFAVPPTHAGGILGELLPALARSELLHTAYNSFQLTGLLLLAQGFRRAPRARPWWILALLAQSWHWLEHASLQIQYLTGHYLYGAIKQMSILERFFPRAELHFAYNLVVFVPTVIAVVLYLRTTGRTRHGG